MWVDAEIDLIADHPRNPPKRVDPVTLGCRVGWMVLIQTTGRRASWPRWSGRRAGAADPDHRQCVAGALPGRYGAPGCRQVGGDRREPPQGRVGTGMSTSP